MKALTLTQPWATLMAVEAKRMETRSWRTSYRGIVAIHAAKGFPSWCANLWQDEPFKQCLAPFTPQNIPRACILAIGKLEQIYTTDEIDRGNIGISVQERAFGDYGPNRYAWRFTAMMALPEPIPCKGALSLWEIPKDIVSKIEAQVQ